MAKALVQRGKNCIALAESLCTDITKGSLDAASKKLSTLRTNGAQLAREAQKTAGQLEEVEKRCLSRAEELQKKISALGCQEEQLKLRKSSLNHNLESQRASLGERERKLSQAEDALSDARRKRIEKEKEASDRRRNGAIGGAIAGIFTLGIGAAVGATVGAGIAELVNTCVEDEERAERELRCCEETCRNIESEIDSILSKILTVCDEIIRLSPQIANLKLKRLEYHEQAGKAKEGVAFFRQASVFWLEFKQISEGAINRTELIQNILCKARKRDNFTFLKSRGSAKVGMTFLEAWTMMEEKFEQGQNFCF